MVFSTPYDEDDPRNVYKAKKLKATVQIKSLKSTQTGLIKSDPDGKSISELHYSSTDSTSTSSYRSHTGHGRSEINLPNVQSSSSSHTIDPSYYMSDGREDRSQFVTRRSAPVSAREQIEPEVVIGGSVSSRLAVYKKNAKIASAPKVSTYSVAANRDRYVQSPMAPVAPGTPVVEVAPTAERRLSYGRALEIEAPEPAEEPLPTKFQNVSSPRNGVKAIAEPASTSSSKDSNKFQNVSSPGNGAKAIAEPTSSTNSKGSNSSKASTSEESKVMASTEQEEAVDKSVEEAASESKQYWEKIKQKQKAKKRMQKMKESSYMTCGNYDDDSTLESTNTELSSANSWNWFDAFLVGPKDAPARHGEATMVTKQQLLCDFEESGVDKVKALHQYLKGFAADGGHNDIVGRHIVTGIENDDDSSKSSMSEQEMQKMGLNAEKEAKNNEQINKNSNSKDDDDNTEKKTTEGDVHTVKYNHQRETSRRNLRQFAEQYIAAASASSGSTASNSIIAKKNDEPKAAIKDENASSKEPSGAVPTRDPVTEKEEVNTPLAADSTPSTFMVDAGSAVSIKSVRFSEQVETHEPEVVESPDVPSLMDDHVEEDDTSQATPEQDQIDVVEETEVDVDAPKKKGFFKKLLRRGKGKNKKRAQSKPFQPTLEPLKEDKEEVEKESKSVTKDAPSTPESESTANVKSTTSSSEIPSGLSLGAEGFELIAGCTKNGKKAIMIAKAKNDRKRESEDPEPTKQQASMDPPTTTATTNDAASVVAKVDEDAKPKSSNRGAEKKVTEEKPSGSIMDDYVNKALSMIQQHAPKRGMNEQELTERLSDTESVASHGDTFVSDGESLYRGESTVASKLLNMFDSIFAAEGEVESVDSQ